MQVVSVGSAQLGEARKSIFTAFASIYLAIAGPLIAEVWFVDSAQVTRTPDGQTWDSAYSTIREGVDAASDGDEVWVSAGIYRPFSTASTNGIPLARSLVIPEGIAVYGGFSGTETLRTERNPTQNQTVITGYGFDELAHRVSPRIPLIVFPPDSNKDTRLDGFRLQHNMANYGTAIHVQGGSPIIANNTIVSNRVDGVLGGSGVFVERTATLQPIDALDFFNQVAGRLFELENRTGSDGRLITHTNIMLWPTNDYDAATHRVVQVAANMYDATTNRGGAYPHFPTVFRPFLRSKVSGGQTNIYVAGYKLQGAVEDPNALVNVTNYWDLNDPSDRDAVPITPIVDEEQPLAIGLPMVVGVKKGFPNFNEFAIRSSSVARRHLIVDRPSLDSPPNSTNQIYTLTLTNQFGVEGWNSYGSAYPRPLKLVVEVDVDSTLQNADGMILWPRNPATGDVLPTRENFRSTTELAAHEWDAGKFNIPLFASSVVLSNMLWQATQFPFFQPSFQSPFQGTNSIPQLEEGFPNPDWVHTCTNRVRYVLMDGNQIVDFVNIDGMGTAVDLGEMLADTGNGGFSNPVDQMWDMERICGTNDPTIATRGIETQIAVSAGFVQTSELDWAKYSPFIHDYRSAQEAFAAFLGLASTGQGPHTRYLEAPFVAGKRVEVYRTYQVDDPFVHHTLEQIRDNRVEPSVMVTGLGVDPLNLAETTLGRPNPRYSSWPGAPDDDPHHYPADLYETIYDPGIAQPADWQFAGGRELNHRFLDRIHRGTPWQTIYYCGQQTFQSDWLYHRGDSYPTPEKDWAWIGEFRRDWLGLPVTKQVIPTPVLVNNTIANNFTSLSDRGAAIHLEPETSPIVGNNIVAFNSAGIEQVELGWPILFSNNIHGNTNGNLIGISPGSYSLDVDPKFMNAAFGDFRLHPTSPLIDAAHASVSAGGWIADDETYRWQNGRPDFGANELSTDLQPWFEFDSMTPDNICLFGYPGLRYEVETTEDLITWESSTETVPIDGRSLLNIAPSHDRLFLRARLSDPAVQP